MSILTIIGDIFNHSPILISLSAALMLGAEVWGLKKRNDLKILEQVEADQETIEDCLRRWRKFRPDFMPIILRDLTSIRQNQDIVRIGHLSWLASKLAGQIRADAAPPTFDEKS